eukprot:gene50130-26134_t
MVLVGANGRGVAQLQDVQAAAEDPWSGGAPSADMTVRVTKEPHERGLPWGMCLAETMELWGCREGTAAERCAPLRACIGMTVVAARGVAVATPPQLAAVLDGAGDQQEEGPSPPPRAPRRASADPSLPSADGGEHYHDEASDGGETRAALPGGGGWRAALQAHAW